MSSFRLRVPDKFTLGKRLPRSNNLRHPYTSANWIARDGTPTAMAPGSLEIFPVRSARVENRDVPVAWRVRISERGFDVTTSPLNDQAWMKTTTPYWEGPMTFEGSVKGQGYLEMTGYEWCSKLRIVMAAGSDHDRLSG